MKVLKNSNGNDTIYPWMTAVSVRNEIKDTTILRLWQLSSGIITKLKPRPGTKAAELVSPSGLITDKGMLLIEELRMERVEYLKQKSEESILM